MSKQISAVGWLVEQMKKCNMTVSVHNTSHQNVVDFYKAIEQAKEMEKQRIMDFANDYGVYLLKGGTMSAISYQETFKSE